MTDDVRAVEGIARTELRDHYRRRGLDAWSDVRLIQAVAQVVARPRQEPATSFVLHAPLELAARAALLGWVDGPSREPARLHILAIAADYEPFEAAADPASEPEPENSQPKNPQVEHDSGSLVDQLADAIGRGDLVETDRTASAVAARARPADLAPWLANALLASTAAAAHAPIFFYQFDRIGPRGELSPFLLRPLARELARHPDRRLRWIDDHHPTARTDPGALVAALERFPLLGVPGNTFIHPLLMQVDESTARDRLGPSLGQYSEAAARGVLRVAARSMLVDDPDHSPYGWSHCLTMPQAVLGLARRTRDPDRALAIAATHVAAFRAGLGRVELPPEEFPTAPVIDPFELATAAATSHDAHVVKYVLACLDAAAWDPEGGGLYFLAARHLLDWWAEQGGDPTDPLA